MIRKSRITLLPVIFLSVFILGASPSHKLSRSEMANRLEELEKENVRLRKQVEDLNLKIEILTSKTGLESVSGGVRVSGPSLPVPGLSVKKLSPTTPKINAAPKGRLIVAGSNNEAKQIIQSTASLPGTNYVPLPDPAVTIKRTGNKKPKKITTPAAPVLAAPKPVSSPGESGDFRKINELMENGSSAEAEGLMDAYLKKHKGAAHENKVAYWKGQRLLEKGDFNQAIDYFKIVTERYPACNDASDALYNIGVSYLELGHTEEAGDALREVNILYPFSEAAGKAEKKLVSCCQ